MAEIKQVACVGSGVIGTSWAVNFAIKGYPVAIYDISAQALEHAKLTAADIIDSLVARSVLTPGDAAAARDRIRYTGSIADAVTNADFVQENGPDRIELKHSILAQIEETCSRDTIIASSTSNLLISEIAEYASYPERVLGAHPFNPPHLIPLVEVCKGKFTSDETVQRAVAFYRSCGKEPAVLQKESIGFIANRLQMALYREAVDLVIRGVCDVASVDAAVTFGPGMRWSALGPNMLYQLGGGQSGLKGLLTALSAGGDALISDLADWKSLPAEWPDLGQKGVLDEMAAMPDFKGHTSEEIAGFRDNVLIDLLKLHRKM